MEYLIERVEMNFENMSDQELKDYLKEVEKMISIKNVLQSSYKVLN